MPYLIGLTGNIACGKSTVLKLLAAHGAAVLDADAITHELQQPGQAVYAQIVDAFGQDILVSPHGPINRKQLGAIVFNNQEALKRLEAIVHPAVRQRIFAWLEEHGWHPNPTSNIQHPTSLLVIDAIKLLESGWKAHCDAVWVVTCAPEQQHERLMRTRGMSAEEATMRIAAQPPQSEKIAQADVVIDNSGSLKDTERQVEAALAAMV